MSDPNGITTRQQLMQRAAGSLGLLGFGLAVLGYLSFIEHQSWFHLKPATGSAVAMSNASTHASKH